MVENKLILYYKDDIEGELPFNDIVITEYNYSDDLMGKTQLSGSFVYPNTSLLELFDKNKEIEEGYVIAVNKSNPINVLNAEQIKNIFDEIDGVEKSNWQKNFKEEY